MHYKGTKIAFVLSDERNTQSYIKFQTITTRPFFERISYVKLTFHLRPKISIDVT